MTLQRTMQRFARWHIWLGWAVAIPILMWTLTGLFMAARPLEEVRGESLLAKPAAIDPAMLVWPKLTARIEEAHLLQQLDGPVWIVTEQGGGKYRYSAKDGSIVPPVIEVEARRIAQSAYSGRSTLEKVIYHPADEAPVDLRRKLNAWQAHFADGTNIYIDDGTGEVLALRTGWWRWYDFMYGLHIMDPRSHEDAHNPFIIVFGLLAVAGAALGSVLLFRRRKARPRA